MNGPRLFHYTCADHGQPGIEPGGLLRPSQHPWLPHSLLWLTDLDVVHREALGLTSHLLSCDRGAVRYEVHPDVVRLCVPWSAYARRLPRGVRELFEEAPGALPAHWWVSESPLLALLPAAVR